MLLLETISREVFSLVGKIIAEIINPVIGVVYAGDPLPGSVPPEVVSLVGRIVEQIVNPIIGVLFAAALVYFLWGLLMFILNAGNESKRGEYKQHMLWGLIGLVVMLSAYGLIEIMLRTFGVQSTDMPGGLPISL